MNKYYHVTKVIVNHPLNKGRKIDALKRMIKWQFATRLLSFPVVMPFIEDAKLIVKRGMTGGIGNIYYGLDEFEDMAFLLHLLREEDFFADIGANIGSYSILASKCSKANSIAFEPVPATFERLKSNIKVNNLEDNVQIMNIGIGSKSDSLFFTQDKDSTNHVVVNDNTSNAVKVDVKRLDSVLDNCPTLMKIDVEGFESEVLNGASAILEDDKLKAIIIELNGSGQKFGFDDGDIIRKLRDLGFQSYDYSPYDRKLKVLEKINPTKNTIFVRDLNFVETRLTEARTFQVLDKKI